MAFMAERQSREVFDRLLLADRDWWMVGVATLGAAIVAVIIVLPVKTTYRTTSVVGLDPAADTANARVDFVADMRAAVIQPSVLGGVAAELDLDRDALEERVTVGRVNDSNLVRVVYEAPDDDAELARQVVELVPREALRFLDAGEVEAAEAAVDSADAAHDEAVQTVEQLWGEIDEALAENNYIGPDVEVQSLQRDLDDARRSLTTVDPDDFAQVAALNTLIVELEAQIDDAALDAAEFADLEFQLDVAREERTELAGPLADARQQVRAAEVRPSVTVQQVASERSASRAAVVQVAVVAALVAIAAVALISWLRRRTDEASRGT